MHPARQQQAWRFLDTSPADGYENMAIDEAIFISCQQKKSLPTVRLYGWRPPAVSLGYFQKVEGAVNLPGCRRLGIDVVRRISGGRAVLHNQELTYAVIAPEHTSPFGSRVLESYMTIGACLMKALQSLGLNVQWVAARDKHRGGASLKNGAASCFSALSWYEIAVDGKKICGSAQKRGNGVFLQHGSILLDHDPELMAAVLVSGKCKEEFLQEIADSTTSLNRHLGGTADLGELREKVLAGFEDTLGITLNHGALTESEIRLKELLLREKYQSAAWNPLFQIPDALHSVQGDSNMQRTVGSTAPEDPFCISTK